MVTTLKNAKNRHAFYYTQGVIKGMVEILVYGFGERTASFIIIIININYIKENNNNS
jgi:hypothetical protein